MRYTAKFTWEKDAASLLHAANCIAKLCADPHPGLFAWCGSLNAVIHDVAHFDGSVASVVDALQEIVDAYDKHHDCVREGHLVDARVALARFHGTGRVIEPPQTVTAPPGRTPTSECQDHPQSECLTDVTQHAEFMADLLALDTFDYEKALRTFQLADSVGHIIDPTAYRNKMEDREAISTWLAAMIVARRAAREFVGRRAAILARRGGAA